jgi:glycosyltransferase involved in cell wall biosynthesis
MYLIVGNFRTSYIVKRRMLSSINPAGSSRMLRLAEALFKCGEDVSILSSGSCISIGYNKKIFDTSFLVKIKNVKIFIASAVTVPYFSAIWELFSLSYLFFKLKNKYDIKVIIMYCYYPSTVLLGLVGKILGIVIVEDLEDIVNKTDINFSKFSFIDYLRQKTGFFLLKISLRISDFIIIPNINFKKHINYNKTTINISGCFDFDNLKVSSQSIHKDQTLRILISGLLNNEQGFDLFLKSLELLNKSVTRFSQYKFLITGYGCDEFEVLSKIKKYENLDIEFYGYVDSNKYIQLLKSSDVCVALQNPNGIFGQLKTPSKAFEYMSYGKMLIVSDVGDFSSLPDKTILLLNIYTPQALCTIFENLTFSIVRIYSRNAFEYSKQNWSYSNVGSQIIETVNSLRK